MADSRAEKLNAARRKLKEFQEQKKLKERSNASPIANNENVVQASTENYSQLPASLNNETILPQSYNGNKNDNIIQYFIPNTQQTLPPNEVPQFNYSQGQTNATSFSFNDVKNKNPSPEMSNENSTVDIKSYFSDNIFQPNHSLENSRNNSNSFNNLLTERNSNHNFGFQENMNNNVDISGENVTSESPFLQHLNTVNNNPNVSQETSNDVNNYSLNENYLGVGDNGSNVRDTGNTNYNILSVFSNSSNTSSHGSSTHTGPFLLNEEIPQQQNHEMQSCENVTKNTQSEESPHPNPNGGYHLFEQTHNENYLGINFGNEEGPGIHMNVNPFEHRDEKMVSDFLDSETSPDLDQSTVQEKSLQSSDDPDSEILDQQATSKSDNTSINLLNDTFRRNLMSLSTSKSTSIEEYTDKSTRGNSTVSKSVSLESGGGGGGGGVYFDDLLMKDSTNSSTVFSSCDNIRKLLSSAAESSSEPPCTNSHCEEACLLELEKRNEELRALLCGEQQKSDQLETQVSQLKSELEYFQTAVSEKDKQLTSLNQEYQTQLKSQTHTIQILIEEKSHLEARVSSSGEMLEGKNKEVEELKGRLAISKHKCANIERDLGVVQEQMKQKISALDQVNAVLAQERKQLEDLAEDKVELTHKLDAKSQELNQLTTLLQERDSQLSLLHMKLQQLSAAGGMQGSDGTNDMHALQQERDQLRCQVTELSEQVKILTRERDKTLQYHVQMIDSLKAKNEELSNLYTSAQTERTSLQAQCQNQIHHIGDLEKQLQNLRENQSQERPSGDDNALKPLVAEMETKIKDLTLEKQRAETSLQAQVLETELAQERVDQLTREIEKLEADRPDASALLSAMESDKIAASRAVQQNSMLKQQLQELQDALIAMNNSKLELTEQLGQEQAKVKELNDKLDKLQHQYEQQQQLEAEQGDQQGAGLTPPGSNPQPVDQNALHLLEEKFKATMKELAELSDEKQRLEHLVTQLQLETETIGEYAALYQKQRYLLQQKSREKDEQVKQLSKDQEALKEKLAKLNALVQDFVSNGSQGVVQGVEALLEATGDSGSAQTVTPPTDSKATQIMALISEIESNSLVEGGVPSSFHPCLVCSGQLITV